MSRNHLRVSAQANNERGESAIIREIMNKATNDYARSEATTEPMAMPPAITPVKPAPVKKGRPTQEIRLQVEIDDLRKELVGSMEGRDAQAEALSRQRESIATLREEIANLKGERNLNLSLTSSLQAKANAEIGALRTLLKIYI